MAPLSTERTRLRVHPLFLLVLAGLAWTGRLVDGATVFGVVLLHELGHALAAWAWGVRVVDVELLPFGGVARMEGVVESDPRVEAAIAAAGPLMNVVLIGVGLFFARLGFVPPDWSEAFILSNAAIAGINLVPALPLDGGRLYRAWRCGNVGYRRATREAAAIGRAAGALLLAGGVVAVVLGAANVSLPGLGLFVSVAAAKEQKTAAYVFMLHLARRREELLRLGCMETSSLAARHDATVKAVAEKFVPRKFHFVWIVDDGGRLVGIASEEDILAVLFEWGPGTPLAAVPLYAFVDRK